MATMLKIKYWHLLYICFGLDCPIAFEFDLNILLALQFIGYIAVLVIVMTTRYCLHLPHHKQMHMTAKK